MWPTIRHWNVSIRHYVNKELRSTGLYGRNSTLSCCVALTKCVSSGSLTTLFQIRKLCEPLIWSQRRGTFADAYFSRCLTDIVRATPVLCVVWNVHVALIMIRQTFVADHGCLECDVGASREEWGLQKNLIKNPPNELRFELPVSRIPVYVHGYRNVSYLINVY
jgi:hypothetical protein